MATHFLERWHFTDGAHRTEIQRSFALHPRSGLWIPALWLISLLLKRAVSAHLRQMREDAEPASTAVKTNPEFDDQQSTSSQATRDES